MVKQYSKIAIGDINWGGINVQDNRFRKYILPFNLAFDPKIIFLRVGPTHRTQSPYAKISATNEIIEINNQGDTVSFKVTNFTKDKIEIELQNGSDSSVRIYLNNFIAVG